MEMDLRMVDRAHDFQFVGRNGAVPVGDLFPVKGEGVLVPDILLIEGSDFETFPAGGQLSMARALMKLFGDRLALVGMSRDGGHVGRWIQKEISGIRYPFLSVANGHPSGKKPLIPARLTFYAGLRRYKKKILSLGCKAAFIQAPEALLAVSRWEWNSLCFWFPGVENQLKASRYGYAKRLSGLFDGALFSSLDRAGTILAAADENAIGDLVFRSKGRLTRDRVIQFPTCVDTTVFHPVSVSNARAELGLPQRCTVFVTTGRIGRLKGWELLLDAFERFLQKDRNALLVFVGDGEDRSLLQMQVERRDLQSAVKVTGFQKPSQVASYINSANVIVSGSMLEGWSVSMLEALACGKAIVSTEVSGVTVMIRSGQNGFIVKNRNSCEFAEAMEKALHLGDAERVSISIASDFTLTRLGERLASAWAPLRSREQGWCQQPADADVGLPRVH